jgi:hypothetical protein
MNSISPDIFREITVFLDSHYEAPKASPKISELMAQYDWLTLELIFDQFLMWILFQQIPSQRKPHELPGVATEVMRALFERSPELAAVFAITNESVDYRPEISLEMREQIRVAVREVFHPEVRG